MKKIIFTIILLVSSFTLLQAADIIDPLQLDDDGVLEQGSIQYTDDGGEIGSLIGPEITNEEIKVSGEILFQKENGISTMTYTGDGSFVDIKDERFENIQGQSETTNAYLKLDSNGDLVGADFTTNDNGGSFNLGREYVTLRPNTRVTLINGQVTIHGKETSFDIGGSQESNQDPLNIKILEGDSITISDGKIIGKGFEGSGFRVIGRSGGLGEVTISNGKVVRVGEKTIANINGIEHTTFWGGVDIYYEDTYQSPLQNLEGNYIYYGGDEIRIGGNGFSSELKEDNKIFEGLELTRFIQGSSLPKLGEFKVTPQNGEIILGTTNVGEISYLDLYGEGDFEIRNGRATFTAKNGNLYASEKGGLDLTQNMQINYDNKFQYTLEDSKLNSLGGNLVIDYSKTNERIIKGVQENLKSGELNKLRSELEDKWGVRPRSYLGTLNDEREEDFVSYVLRASEIASNNKFGVEITPTEVANNFLSEGGIRLFESNEHDYLNLERIINKGDKTFNFNGKDYEVFEEDMSEDLYIKIETEGIVGRQFGFLISDFEDKGGYVNINNKKYNLNYGEDYVTIKTDDFTGYYSDHNIKVSGIMHLGTDVAGDIREQDRLKSNGFWPEDLEVTSREFTQEQGSKVLAGNFNSLEDGLVGMAGILAEKKYFFIRDFESKFGTEELDKLSDEEKSFWTYVYFNCGQGCGKGHLYGEEFKTGGNTITGIGRENLYQPLPYEEPESHYVKSVQVNALRRLTSQLIIEDSLKRDNLLL